MKNKRGTLKEHNETWEMNTKLKTWLKNAQYLNTSKTCIDSW